MVHSVNHSLVLLLLALSAHHFVLCIDFRNVEQQNFQENFQRVFVSQLDLIENQNVGCLFDKDVCSPDDRCHDDGLFGTCIAAYAGQVTLSYRIPTELLRDLKAILAKLAADRYSWHDRYTQCCVRAALICGSMEIATDVSVCREFETINRAPVAQRSRSGRDRPETDRDRPETERDRPETERDRHETERDRPETERDRPETERDRPETERDRPETERDRPETERDRPEIERDRPRPAWPGDLKKRLELLNRKKYEYLLDIPEKKLEQTDLTLMPEEPGQKQQQKQQLKQGGSEFEPENEQSDGTASDDTRRPIDDDQPETERSSDSAESPWPQQPPQPQAASEPSAEVTKRRQRDPSFIDGGYLWLRFDRPSPLSDLDVKVFIARLNRLAGRQLLGDRFSVNGSSGEVYFEMAPQARPLDVQKIFGNGSLASELKAGGKFDWSSYGFGRPQNRVEAAELSGDWSQHDRLTSTLIVCSLVMTMIAALFVVFLVQRFRSSKKKFRDLTAAPATGGNADYQDLCRQRMLGKTAEQHEPVSAAAQRIASARPPSDSTNSSTGSWSEDPITTDMDIITGHLILNYMENYLGNREKLEQEWESLCAYEADQSSSEAGAATDNVAKNRYPDLLPYDHTRVVLDRSQNATGSDYISASFISDSDPKMKSYILAQGPTEATAGDFWQMLWEMGTVTIVNLTKLRSEDSGQELCTQYWPSEGSRLFNNKFEVHLVSEHIWCEAFVVRNFYLKNLSTGEARTVTMFHFLAWADGSLPPSARTLLDFRRKVNKSYKGRTSPLVIHCSDGCGRSGTYCLLDLALGRINKGVKEIDPAASLEHLRDQRPGLVKTRDQFEFVVTAIADEVHSLLKTLPQ